jgi:hypothetical protein
VLRAFAFIITIYALIYAQLCPYVAVSLCG